MIITEARNLAIKEILPTRQIGDQEGGPLEDGKVTVPESFTGHSIFKEGEWIAMTEDVSGAGRGCPHVALAAGDYFNGANYPPDDVSGAHPRGRQAG